jgi:hypothetical protein
MREHNPPTERISDGISSREYASPVEKLTDVSGLTLTGDELLVVAERDQPPLAAQRAHLADMIDIHQCVSMDSPEARIYKALLQYLKGLSGKVLSLGCNDPDELALCLKRKNFIRDEQEVFTAEPSHDPLCTLGR